MAVYQAHKCRMYGRYREQARSCRSIGELRMCGYSAGSSRSSARFTANTKRGVVAIRRLVDRPRNPAHPKTPYA